MKRAKMLDLVVLIVLTASLPILLLLYFNQVVSGITVKVIPLATVTLITLAAWTVLFFKISETLIDEGGAR